MAEQYRQAVDAIDPETEEGKKRRENFVDEVREREEYLRKLADEHAEAEPE